MDLDDCYMRTLHSNEGEVVYFSRDEFGQILVIDNGEYRVLNFDSVYEQSCMRIDHQYRLVHKYTRLMLMVLAYSQPNRIIMFGLGGGSLLRTLHYLLPDCFFSVVELRSKVVDVAMEYFYIPVDHRVGITVNDGLVVASRQESQSSDLVFADMYNAYSMVQEQIQSQFLYDCSKLLTNKGWLVINLHSVPKDRDVFFERFKKYFPTLIIGSSTGNIVLFASKRQPRDISLNKKYIELAELSLGQSLMPMLSKLKPVSFNRHAEIH